MKRLILLLWAVLFSIQIIAQKLLDLNTLKIYADKVETIPSRDVEETNDGLTITYRFDKVLLQKDELYKEASYIKIDGFWLNSKEGEPAILSRWDTFIVPSTDAKVMVTDSVFSEYQLELAAARPPLENSGNVSYTRENVKPISAYNGFFPNKLIPSTYNCEYRNQPLLKVCVCPLQYNYISKTVRIYKEIKYKVVFNNKSKPDLLKNKSLLNNTFLRNITVNGPSYLQTDVIPRNSATQLANRHYLIITVPKYEPAANRFAEWKRRLGYNVHITTQATWDTTAVKNAVRNAYLTYGIENLLIIGKYSDVPTFFRDRIFNFNHHVHTTDLYYGCLGNDYTPSIFRGRLLVKSLAEANVVVDKIINYEKNPVTDTAFYDKGIHCAYFQDFSLVNNENVTPGDGKEDRRFTYTSERILNGMMTLGKSVSRIYYTEPDNEPLYWNDGSEIPASLRKPTFAWNGNNNDITNKINQKAFYIFMRDHGDVDNWASPSYTINDINNLTNSNYLPVVFSICCKTGQYCYGDCFCNHLS